MERDKIEAEISRVQAQIVADEKEQAVLESKIQQLSQELGISPEDEGLERKISEIEVELKEKESEIERILSEIDKFTNASC